MTKPFHSVQIRHARSLFWGFCCLLLSFPLCAQESIEQALRRHVNYLASEALEGRGAGTEAERTAGAYIARELASYGIELLYTNGVQDFSVTLRAGDTLQSQNIVAVLPGSDSLLREEYIVIGAHYDHLGRQLRVVNGEETWMLYPGADDNASGVALMLELARMAADQPYMFKRSLVFVGFGAEEIGLFGSWYFVNRAFSQIYNTVGMLNLDMLGRSGRPQPLVAYTVAPHAELAELLALAADTPLSVKPRIEGADYFPSDHRNFHQKGIPSVLFTSGLHADYHSVRDRPALLDYTEMEGRLLYIYAFMLHIANTKTAVTSWSQLATAQEHAQAAVYSLSEVDKRPQFQHGEEAQFLKLWIHKYLKYPETAVAQGIQGRVMVQFVVEANGAVSQVEVLKSVDPLLDDEAVRVVAASPKWKAATKDGEAVRCRMVIPVQFNLRKR
jgi:TonB family C-terminal domain